MQMILPFVHTDPVISTEPCHIPWEVVQAVEDAINIQKWDHVTFTLQRITTALSTTILSHQLMWSTILGYPLANNFCVLTHTTQKTRAKQTTKQMNHFDDPTIWADGIEFWGSTKHSNLQRILSLQSKILITILVWDDKLSGKRFKRVYILALNFNIFYPRYDKW